MKDVGVCLICGYPVDDGLGEGYMRRHLDSTGHLRMIKRNQEAAKRAQDGFVPWTAIDLDAEDVESAVAEEDRLALRRELEALQAQDEIPEP